MTDSESQAQEKLAWTVEESDEQMRLDSFLVQHFPEFSRAKIQRSIAAGRAWVNHSPAKASSRLSAGQTVEFIRPSPTPTAPIPEDIPLDVVYEDDWLAAINKPPGMVVHPAKGHWAGTLTSAIAHRFQQLSTLGGETRPGIVHRLDRDTSGVIVIAKTDAAHARLARQFEERTIEKEYWTVVSPAPDRDRDIIDQPIGAHPYQREMKAIRHHHSTSKSAQTFYEVVERYRGFAIVRVKPKTGRTHQIRVHMAHIGCPVLCDRLYSGRAKLTLGDLNRNRDNHSELILERQALHAYRLALTHPDDGSALELVAPLPDDLVRAHTAIAANR